MSCRLSVSITVPVALLLLMAPLVHAQTGTLRGTITDTSDGTPVEGARVIGLETRAPLTGPSGQFETDSFGQLELSLVSGIYSLVVESPGYAQARIDVEVIAGEVTEIAVSLDPFSFMLDPVVATAEPWRSEPTSTTPARVIVVQGEQVRTWGGPTLAQSIAGLPGMDVAQTGLTPSNIVGRGFNNVFSGALLVLVDNRYARLPSLRLNAYNMIPTTVFDVERIELVLGPAAALYGPNTAAGVLHVITSSPIDRPGTDVSLSGGERSVFEGVFRHASRLSERVGVKLSGQYFQGNEWEHVDPVEEANRSPANPLIGRRDFDTQRFSGDLRLDLRPWGQGAGEIVLAGGINQIQGIELTPLGAAQASEWRYMYGQARIQKGGLFAQAFLNQSNSGDTYLLRTGTPIVDESLTIVAQTRYSFESGEQQEWVAGIDLRRTENEDDDVISEVGGYLHSRTRLSDQADFVAAVRVDKNYRLEDPNFSPRVGIVFTPEEGHHFRLTYNRAFATPTTNNLFLDLVAGRIPLGGGLGYDVRALGTPFTGLTYEDRCEGGFEGLCMYSPFAPNQKLPADGTLLWNDVLQALALADSTVLPIATFLMSPGSDPGDPALASGLLTFNQEAGTFLPEGGPQAIDPLRSAITNTIELGYKGLIADRLSLSVDVYSSSISDFVGPLRIETPSVFLTPESIQEFVTHRLTALLASGAVTAEDVANIVAGLAQTPLGTITPDQRSGSDLLVLSRNFGDVNLWGADLGFELHVTNEVIVTGSFSFVSEECFDFNDDGA